jgi:hypothetical protein
MQHALSTQCHLAARTNGGWSLRSSTSAPRSATARGAHGGTELTGVVVAQATHRQGGVTRSSSPRLLAGASIVETYRLGGAATASRQRGGGQQRGGGRQCNGAQSREGGRGGSEWENF